MVVDPDQGSKQQVQVDYMPGLAVMAADLEMVLVPDPWLVEVDPEGGRIPNHLHLHQPRLLLRQYYFLQF
jgi:hypothetical protein